MGEMHHTYEGNMTQRVATRFVDYRSLFRFPIFESRKIGQKTASFRLALNPVICHEVSHEKNRKWFDLLFIAGIMKGLYTVEWHEDLSIEI